MRTLARPPWARMRGVTAAFIVAGAALAGPAAAQTHAPPPVVDGISPHIDAVLYDPAVSSHIRSWGLSVADVQHDIDTMSRSDRARLAYLLTRRWPADDSHDAAGMQAQFLVMMSLMRESVLFASVLSTNPGRLLR